MSAAGGARLLATSQHVDVNGRALFPGVPLQIDVDDDVPPGAVVEVVVQHDGTPFIQESRPALGGQHLVIETPYPFDDLVPGTYLVRVDLLDRGGRPIEQHAAGGYRLGKHRFSA